MDLINNLYSSSSCRVLPEPLEEGHYLGMTIGGYPSYSEDNTEGNTMNEDGTKRSLQNVLGILSDAQDVLLASSFFDGLLEPTPIGPNAVLSSHDGVRVISNTTTNNLPNKRQLDSMSRSLLHQEHRQKDQGCGLTPRSCQAELAPLQKKHRGPNYSPPLLQSNEQDLSTPLALITTSSGEQQEEENSPLSDQFRQYQSDQWNDRFQDLLDFKDVSGHCLVPHDFPANQRLAQWVKRQRYQYKLKQAGRHSTLTDSRQMQLESSGFVWDSHQATWDERFESLKAFRMLHGHCNVPSNYQEDKALAVWVKCQRRQMKLLLSGQKSSLSESRIYLLNILGLEWNPRNL